MLLAGNTAPDFALPDQDGNLITLEALLSSGPLILFFYPADFTPICTKEACLFRDSYAELAAAGLSVAGVSPNDSESHDRFRDRHQLTYPLLADPDKQVVTAFGVAGPLGIGVRRASFLIGPDKQILAAVRADLRLKPHSSLMHQALAIMKEGEGKMGSEPLSRRKGL
jgi:peroxiredoxin Q/BCP